MPNTRCPSPSSTVVHSGSAESHEVDLVAEGDAASTEPAAASSTNPFSSFAPRPGGVQDPGAETKLFQVPRELIELARARANRPSDLGTVTPVAPRPGPELEATLRAYVASMSSLAEPTAARDVVAPVAAAARSNASLPAEPFELRKNPSQHLTLPRLDVRRHDGGRPQAQHDSTRKQWVVCAALSLILGCCLYVLLVS